MRNVTFSLSGSLQLYWCLETFHYSLIHYTLTQQTRHIPQMPSVSWDTVAQRNKLLAHTHTRAGMHTHTQILQTVRCTKLQTYVHIVLLRVALCVKAVITSHSFRLRLASIVLLAFFDQLSYCLWYRKN